MPKKKLLLLAQPTRHQRKTDLSRLPPLHRADLEGRLRVDFACSPQRWGMTAVCAFRPAGVDVAGFREIMARRGGQARAQALTEERRREIASKAGKAAAENMSSDESAARVRRAARLRWAARRERLFLNMNEL